MICRIIISEVFPASVRICLCQSLLKALLFVFIRQPKASLLKHVNWDLTIAPFHFHLGYLFSRSFASLPPISLFLYWISLRLGHVNITHITPNTPMSFYAPAYIFLDVPRVYTFSGLDRDADERGSVTPMHDTWETTSRPGGEITKPLRTWPSFTLPWTSF